MPWKYSGRVIKVGKSWTNNDGITHPNTWGTWSDADKTAAGLTWEADPATYDNRFYWDAATERNIADVNETDDDGNAVLDDDGNQVVTKGLKTLQKELVKRQAADKLSETDWMVIKAAEVSSYSVPADVLTARAAIRTASNTIEASIDAAADHAAFRALFDVPTDDDGNPTGNAPVNDWPE